MAATALGALGCVPARTEAPARVLTLAEIRDAARDQQVIGGVPFGDMVAFRGQPIAQRSPPFSDRAVVQRSALDGIPVFAAFSEGAPAAYFTTDAWYDRSPVWVQPEYIPVTAWDPQDPEAHRLPGGESIWSVGPESSFYSPFWQIEYVVVPAGTDPATLHTQKSVVDPGYPIHPGPLRLGSIVPDDIGLASPDGSPPVRPFNGDAVGPVRIGHGWVDGERYQVFDFGDDRFTLHGTVVDETPIYHFAKRGAGGAFTPYGLPSIGGVGPFGTAARAGAVPRNAPRFGGLWRLYFVELPAGAAVFVPPSLPAWITQLRGQGLSVPALSAAVAASPLAADYTGRVALDPSCLTGDGSDFPQGCTWLDAQAQLETRLSPTAFHKSELTLTCPLVEYLGQPVPN